MARENKAKRDERRFGKPTRLADLVLNGPYAESPHFTISDEKKWLRCRLMDVKDIVVRKVIEASNIFDHTRKMDSAGKKFKYDKDIKGAIPPFDSCFVEFRVPDSVSPQVRHLGVAINAYRPGQESQIVYDALAERPCPEIYSQSRWIVTGHVVMGMLEKPGSSEEGAFPTGVQTITFLDDNGDSLQPPIMQIPQAWGDDTDWIEWWSAVSMFDCLMTFRFMNCANVCLKANQPDIHINRERAKADKIPLVKYHTIVIDPSRREETNRISDNPSGDEISLHVCRGHFKTWTTSYFGRPIDKPVTYWVPSHVKGSADRGVVVSDYNVKPPGDTP